MAKSKVTSGMWRIDPRKISRVIDRSGQPVASVGQEADANTKASLIAAAPDGTEAHFFRTSAGAEIDLVVTLPGGPLWAIEIKRSSAPKIERGFHNACAGLKPKKRFVVYPGSERFALDDDTDAIGVVALARILQSLK